MSTIAPSPMMAQWHACKESAKDAILFFRLGDFYEAFYEDAELISKELDLTLTKRQEIPMAGVPHHSCEGYIDKLVAKGYSVAIAEQMENPKHTKGIVQRKIVRTVTPGTLISSSLLQDKEQNYLASIVIVNQTLSLACLDITTAHFFVIEFESKKALLDEVALTCPKEIILSNKWKEDPLFLKELNTTCYPKIHFLENWHFEHKSALAFLQKHFKVHSLDGFGLSGKICSITAAASLLTYIQEDLSLPILHITNLQTKYNASYMLLDKNTKRHLELLEPLQEGRKETTLLSLLDQTKTPMGGRLLRSFLLHPLLSIETIRERQDKVEGFTKDFSTLLTLRNHLAQVRDLERLTMRIETRFATPKDLLALQFSLEKLPFLAPFLPKPLPEVDGVAKEIAKALVENPSAKIGEGEAFKIGYHAELDVLLRIKKDSHSWIAAYQTRLRESLGIKTIKVGYTKAFGYYIEVSLGQTSKIPSYFQRRQTLVNAERFVTTELKEFEYKILSADEKISAFEYELFIELCQKIAQYGPQLRQIADLIAHLDCYSALAKLALEHNYVRPLIDTSTTFVIEKGRHPIIEVLQEGDFIANDLILSCEKQLAIITGPNMAGKSTFIRQAALIAIMAQMGSFVPAQSAHIGIIDKVFSRIGASDNLSKGQSTFMVEMAETANILHNATSRSLVILDEIGRGTSTYDGISIAWAVAQYLLTKENTSPKTLFATHYFEMTDLPQLYPKAFNLTVAIQETAEEIVFLRKIIEGAADKSYGIHVAKLAGLPYLAIQFAEKKLKDLETKPSKKLQAPSKQLELFSPSHPVLDKLKTLDPNQLTPLQALQLITQWKQDAL